MVDPKRKKNCLLYQFKYSDGDLHFMYYSNIQEEKFNCSIC